MGPQEKESLVCMEAFNVATWLCKEKLSYPLAKVLVVLWWPIEQSVKFHILPVYSSETCTTWISVSLDFSDWSVSRCVSKGSTRVTT